MSAPIAKPPLVLAGEAMWEAQEGDDPLTGLEAWLPDHMLEHRHGRLRGVKHQARRPKKLSPEDMVELERIDREINEGIERIRRGICRASAESFLGQGEAE